MMPTTVPSLIPASRRHPLDSSVMRARKSSDILLAREFGARAVVLKTNPSPEVLADALKAVPVVTRTADSKLDFDLRSRQDFRQIWLNNGLPGRLSDYVLARFDAIHRRILPQVNEAQVRLISSGAESGWHRDSFANVYVETLLGPAGTRLALKAADAAMTEAELHDMEGILSTCGVTVSTGEGVLFNLNWDGQARDYGNTGVVHSSPPTARGDTRPRLALAIGLSL